MTDLLIQKNFTLIFENILKFLVFLLWHRGNEEGLWNGHDVCMCNEVPRSSLALVSTRQSNYTASHSPLWEPQDIDFTAVRGVRLLLTRACLWGCVSHWYPGHW
jgi:hypothetical protein